MSVLSRQGYDHATQTAIKDQLTRSGTVGLRAELQDRNGENPLDISRYVTGGQVTVGTAGRTCSFGVYDPRGDLGLTEQAAYLQLCCQFWRRAYVDSLSGWYEWPVHRGPLTKADPTGPNIEVNSVGQSHLALGNVLTPRTVSKGHVVVNAITSVLHDSAGIPLRDINFPALQHTLPKDATAHFGTTWRGFAAYLAASINRTLYTDPGGIWLLREDQTEPDLVWTEGDGGTINTDPARTQALTDDQGNPLPNVVRVLGYQAPKGKPGSIDVMVYADPNGLVGAHTLAVGGQDFNVLKTIHQPHVKTEDMARQVGASWLLRQDQAAWNVTMDVDGMLLSTADYNDCSAVEIPSFHQIFNLRDFSFSLGGEQDDASGTVGYTRMLSYAGARAVPK